MFERQCPSIRVRIDNGIFGDELILLAMTRIFFPKELGAQSQFVIIRGAGY